MEMWKHIEGHNGYMVSNKGKVKSMPSRYNGYKEIILKPDTNSVGYHRVTLGNKQRLFVHRLVASAFCEKTKNKDYVNHIDNNRSNNISSNLEWCTHSENMKHSHAQNRSPQAKENMINIAERKRKGSIEFYKNKLGDRFIDMYSVKCKNGTRGKIICTCYCGLKIDTRTDSTIAKRGFVCTKCNILK